MKSKRAREAAEADETPVDAVAEAPAKKRKRDGDQDGAAVKKSKKDKKDKKDKKKDKKESRKEKKEKRKDLRNLPEEDGLEEDANGEAAAAPEPETKAVNGTDKDKEQKKREKRELKKQKKQEKGENKAKNAPPPKKEEANGDIAAAGKESPNEIDLDASTATKPDRHIVFVGNLPFSATAATISAHFASLSPIAVRCLKNKDDDNPCRGIAFVEFGKVWHQRTCLDKFHHSMFEDGVSPARRINVELTYAFPSLSLGFSLC